MSRYNILNYELKSKKNLVEFFVDNEIKTIALYGVGTIAKYLYNQLCQTDIEIAYCIDKSAAYFEGYEVVRPEAIACSQPVDMIVICIDQENSNSVIKYLSGFKNIKFITVEEMVQYLYLKNIIIPYVRDKKPSNNFVFYSFPSQKYLTDRTLLEDMLMYCNLAYLKETDLEMYKLMSGCDEDYDAEIFKTVKNPPPVFEVNGVLRHSDVKTKYLNIIDGDRQTLPPPSPRNSKICYILGACTAWGIGLEDKKTIASMLQLELNKSSRHNNIMVVNRSAVGAINRGFDEMEPYLVQNYSHNSIVTIMSHVYFDHVYRPYLHGYLNAAITKSGIENLRYYDFYNEFNEKQKERSLYLNYGHLNANGAALIAKLLYDIIIKLPEDKASSASGYKDSIPRAFTGQTAASDYETEIRKYLNSISSYKPDTDGIIGAIVMNCNPFTNGHRYLIEKALENCDFLYVFVVEENKSEFTFTDRYNLVKEGVKDLGNVAVVPGGRFIISTVTFPEYFDKASISTTIDTTFDVTIFAKYIASALGISVRFVGDEPMCNVTRQYNEKLQEVLPQYGIELKVFDRVEQEGEPISASRVRELIHSRDFESIKQMVPKSTYDFICSRKDADYKESSL